MKISGSWASWIYQLALGLLKSTLKQRLETQISEIVDDTIRKKSGPLLKKLKSKAKKLRKEREKERKQDAGT